MTDIHQLGAYYERAKLLADVTTGEGLRLALREPAQQEAIFDAMEERIEHQMQRFREGTAPFVLFDPMLDFEACAVVLEEAGELGRAICERPKPHGSNEQVFFEATQLMAVAYQVARGCLNRTIDRQ